jgi:haloalkane dehalogenase
VAVSAFVRDIPMSPSHASWATLAGAERGLVQFRDRPALIIWGGRDFCFNDSFFERWKQELPQAEAHYLADAGHYVLEDARDDVITRAVDFLSQT